MMAQVGCEDRDGRTRIEPSPRKNGEERDQAPAALFAITLR